MQNNFQTLKRASHVAVAAMAVLLLLSLVYWKERMLFIDASYVLFNIANDGTFMIPGNRFGAFITQLVPFTAAKLHVPVKAMMIAYSASYNVFYCSVVAILVFKYRQYAFAILMTLYYLLFVSHTYFWTINESHQGVAWMFLMFGTTLYGGSKGWNFILISVLFVLFGFLAISSHLLVAMPALFLWVYIIFDRDICMFNLKKTIVLSALLLLLVGIKFSISITQPYDGDKMHNAANFTLLDIYNTAFSAFGLDFLMQCVRMYWFVPLTGILGMYSLLKDKKYRQTIIVIGAVLMYYMFMCLTFSNIEYMPRFYIESEWMCLGIIVATPFVLHFLPELKPSVALYSVAFIVLVRIIYIVQAAPVFTQRIKHTEDILATMRQKGITKLGIIEEPALQKFWIMDWALPEESLLLSAANGDNPQRSFFVYYKNIIPPEVLNDKKIFIGCFHNYTPAEMNPLYFNTDTLSTYQIMNYKELMK